MAVTWPQRDSPIGTICVGNQKPTNPTLPHPCLGCGNPEATSMSFSEAWPSWGHRGGLKKRNHVHTRDGVSLGRGLLFSKKQCSFICDLGTTRTRARSPQLEQRTALRTVTVARTAFLTSSWALPMTLLCPCIAVTGKVGWGVGWGPWLRALRPRSTAVADLFPH